MIFFSNIIFRGNIEPITRFFVAVSLSKYRFLMFECSSMQPYLVFIRTTKSDRIFILSVKDFVANERLLGSCNLISKTSIKFTK